MYIYIYIYVKARTFQGGTVQVRVADLRQDWRRLLQALGGLHRPRQGDVDEAAHVLEDGCSVWRLP